MLNFQTKSNAFSAPTAFIAEKHDAEEFNSSHEELVNLVESARITPTNLGSWASDDTTQLTQAFVVNRGMLFEDATATPNTIILNPFGPSTVDLPTIASMDNYTLKFRALVANTGACTVTAFGVTRALTHLDLSALIGGDIAIDGIYTIIWNNTSNVWMLQNKILMSVDIPRYHAEGFNHIIASGHTMSFFSGSAVGVNNIMINTANNPSWTFAAFTKVLNSTFVAGAGNGAAIPSILPLADQTFYYIYAVLIGNMNGVDIVVSDSIDPASVTGSGITGLIDARRIGAFYNLSTGISAMKKIGKYVSLTNPLHITHSGLSTSGVRTLLEVTAPALDSITLSMAVRASFTPIPRRMGLIITNADANPGNFPFSGINLINEADTIFTAIATPKIDSGVAKISYEVADLDSASPVDPNSLIMSVVGYWDSLDNGTTGTW